MTQASARNAYDPFLTFATLLAVWAAVLPLVRVLEAGVWLGAAALVTTAVLGMGLLLRWLRQRARIVFLSEVAVYVLLMTVLFASETALFAIIPTPATIATIPDTVDSAMRLIVEGSAPLPVTAELAFLVIGALGLATLALDALVLGARWALLAVPALAVVMVIPSMAVPGALDGNQFVVFAACIALLLRAEVRGRERIVDGIQRSSPGVAASAATVAAAAIIITVIVAPVLPDLQRAAPAPLSIFSERINPTLALGNDLRSPTPIEVLRLRTSAPNAPYLRVVTLSVFDGEVWQPDRGDGVALDGDDPLIVPEVGSEVQLIGYESIIDVVNLVSPWLPLPYPTVALSGLSGEWFAIAGNQTVFSRTTTSADQRYTATSLVPRPTLEQARAEIVAGGATADRSPVATTLPANMPEIVSSMAREVTGAATNDYDRLVALQRWFRGTEFQYSLEAPVDAGFDGAGVDAVAAFLEVRAGYCIHFASAFALMARSLGMPTRIVVGYLPGTATPERFDGQSVFSVSSTQLHAWPEVLFPNFGWVPFEPTNSLGSPTSFTPGSDTGTDGINGEGADPNADGAGATPTPTPTLGPDDPTRADDAVTARGTDPTPWLLSLTVLVLVLVLPTGVREMRRRGRLTATRAGDAVAAWREVLDQAVDLGIRLSPGESPRMFARRMVDTHGAPERELGLLVSAIEDASYAPGSAAWHFAEGPALADAVRSVRSGLLRTAAPAPRVLSVFAPRSLIIRATSAFASAEDNGARGSR